MADEIPSTATEALHDADSISQVTPDESFLWASGVIRESQNKDSYPQELIGTAHIVVQLYYMSMQVNLLNRLIANVDAEDEPRNEG